MNARPLTGGRYVAIHGHFYQPPRENPWLEAVEVQDSAAPYHDWNERVTAECYAPNTAARRVGQDNRIIDIVNNFEKISFNVGPTLLSWLDRHAPHVYQSILEADRRSAQAHGGHGNAIAQVYNHMILPLASRRDKVTQVLWGRKDFQERFGRDPEGMWLPETAVDNESLGVLADAGMKFTILAPHQAWRIRRIGTEAWQEVNDRVDPSRPYLWRGSEGRTLSIFFYDGPISRAIAFENALDRGENLVARLKDGFVPDRDGAQLVHCATDGESYGHHKPFGDMALAAAIAQIEADGVCSADELRRISGRAAAHLRGRDSGAHLVELCPWGRPVAERLRMPDARGLASTLARPPARVAGLAAGPHRRLLRIARLGPPQEPLGGTGCVHRRDPRSQSGRAGHLACSSSASPAGRRRSGGDSPIARDGAQSAAHVHVLRVVLR